jgi:O-antigen/teichoic acid export membrane protein
MNDSGQVRNENVSPVREIVKDLGCYIPARVIPALTGIAAVLIYTRLLTPEQYGLYILAITTISITTSIMFEWLNRAMIRYFDEYRRKESLVEFYSTVGLSLAGISILVLFIWYVMISLLTSWLTPKFVILLKIGGLVLLTQAGYTIILALKRASRESSKYALYSILNALSKLGIAVAFLYLLHLGPRGILWGMVISASSIVLWEFYRLYTKELLHFSVCSKKLFKQLLSYGLPLTGVSMASLVLASADRYMIGYFLGAGDVGTYSASYNISNMSVQFLAGILMLAAYPVIIQTFERRDENSTKRLLTKTTAMYIISIMPIAFGITALSKAVGSMFLGESFQDAYRVIPWVAWGGFCFGLTQYIYKPFELKKKTNILVYLVLVAAILNIILNLFFIPQFGILGAAYSTLISYVVYLLVTWVSSRRILIWSFPAKSFVKSLVASLGMCVGIFFIQVRHPTNLGFLAVEVFIGATIYAIIMFVLREEIILQGLKHFSTWLRIRGYRGR